MKRKIRYGFGIGLVCVGMSAQAQFVPLPPFTVYGEVRSWNGRAFSSSDVVTVVAKVDGHQADRCEVVAGVYPGLNYRLHIPMATTPADGRGETGDPITFEVYYDGTLHATFSGTAEPVVVGQPAGIARCNLFVATDADGDGLPDEYENLLRPYYAAAGKGSSIWHISPDDDFDGDGYSNLEEFYAGTSPVDANDFLRIEAFYPVENGLFALTFLSAPGRTYTLPQTDNLTTNPWKAATFALAITAQPNRTFYSSETDAYTTLYLSPTNHAAIRLEVQ